MAGTFASKASLLSTGPGADQSIRIAVYCEYWWSIEFLNPLIELEENIPTFSKPGLTREHIRRSVNNRSVLRPVCREFLREFLSSTDRDVSNLDKRELISFVSRQNSLN